MEEEWIKFLRENHPKFYEAYQRSVGWALEWRDNEIEILRARNAELEAEVKRLNNNFDSASLDLWNCVKHHNAAKKRNAEIEAELNAVMHFVDKWLDGDELRDTPANRANNAREKALKAIESLQAEVARLRKGE